MTVDNMQERAGAVTFKGQPMTLLGPELRVGDPAPEILADGGGPLERHPQDPARRGEARPRC